MRIKGNGKVGIGTNSPSTYLVVGEDGGGDSSATPGIHMKSTSSERKHYVVGQATDRNAFLTWNYNATANSAYAHLGTYGGSNSLAPKLMVVMLVLAVLVPNYFRCCWWLQR